MSVDRATYDLAIVGGGINGCGIARDAAGRGLKVVLIEQGDLAGATSGWSSKLIHGGLRYLEQYAFKLVRESLQEREKLLAIAPHIIEPLTFVIPHVTSMRPAWMLRTGLFIYDHLGGKVSLPRSYGVDFPDERFSVPLKRCFARGFVYSDARVDDARLTVLNAVAAHELGATIMTRSRVVSAKRSATSWLLDVESTIDKSRSTIEAKVVVNAAGPWVQHVLESVLNVTSPAKVRLVKGSHIVVPRVYAKGRHPDHAYLCQNPDGRIVFILPFEERFSLIGTTDIAVNSIEEARDITQAEIRYLIDAANPFLATPIHVRDVVWTYAGVRPLYDDGRDNPSKVTRDYVLKLDQHERGAPVLSVFGGKVTTYRRLSEHAMEYLQPLLPSTPHTARGPWTANEVLPGGDFDVGESREQFALRLHSAHTGLPPDYLQRLVVRYGTRAQRVLAGARNVASLGEIFGEGKHMLTEREIDYVIANEWAMTAEDILWRRTKCGLHMDANEQARATAFIEQKLRVNQ
jgi:glycerol-3-phosphate dehydrogenase